MLLATLLVFLHAWGQTVSSVHNAVQVNAAVEIMRRCPSVGDLPQDDPPGVVSGNRLRELRTEAAGIESLMRSLQPLPTSMLREALTKWLAEWKSGHSHPRRNSPCEIATLYAPFWMCRFFFDGSVSRLKTPVEFLGWFIAIRDFSKPEGVWDPSFPVAKAHDGTLKIIPFMTILGGIGGGFTPDAIDEFSY